MDQQRVDAKILLSKTLSKLLRHNALKEGLNINSEGFIAVDELLKHKFLRGKYTLADLEAIVHNNDKQRFSLRTNDGGILEIRANQGHSIEIVNNLALNQVHDASQFQNVIHGTYYKNWDSIKQQGLSRMNRIHIHFAKGLPNDGAVISGMRKSAQIYIYINLQKALDDGIQFFTSANDVILSPGNKEGIIEAKYFFKVINSKTGKELVY